MFKPVPTGDRIRYSYARINEALEMPHLIDIQRKSYEWFKKEGLKEVFKDISPIKSGMGTMELTFEDFILGEPKYDVETCKERDKSYGAPLNVDVRLFNKETGEIKENRVFMGEFPLMTENGTFVINGAERVIVSQLVRSPGVYYDVKTDPGDTTNKRQLYSAQIIPNRGEWIEYEASGDKEELTEAATGTELKDEAPGDEVIYARLSRTRKLPATVLLRVMGLPTNEDIINCFGKEPALLATFKKDPTTDRDSALVEIYKKLRPGDPATLENATQLLESTFFDSHRYDLANVGRYKFNKRLCWRRRLLGKELAEDLRYEGKLVLKAGKVVDKEAIEKIETSGIFSKCDYSSVLVNYQNKVHRVHFTCDIPEKVRTITPADVIVAFGYFLNVMNGMGGKDDIDHLGNRRVRCVGELLQNQFRIGLGRVEKAVKERMSSSDAELITPQYLINNRPLAGAIREFFGSSQLSQFMDQNNPLAELTNKRRLSALGPGGLSRERAGFDVRDVNHSHYGRMCPIETPEGPNIGLIGALSTFAVINKYGFIETPYRRVDKKNRKVTDEIIYVTADEEDEYVIAQANEPLDENGRFLGDRVTARFANEVLSIPPERCDFMDVSPKQVVSVATALIPFLENDDANRALMGANMQRQAVPLLSPQAPIVGTGMEYKVATDSGVCVLAKAPGIVESVTGDKIVVRNNKGEEDEYNLLKFKRSNQGTCVNQRAVVNKGDRVKKNQVLADGPATDHGELALGRNVIVAYMPWEGYNYEDAVLLSEDLVKDDIYTSIHIEEYKCESRDTKLGKEEITRDIPNISEEALKDLDENGIIRIGAEVRPGDILVGKVTPKGETELSAEERLIRAIFAEKAREVRDSSLRVPHGEQGIIVSVQVFDRDCDDELPPGINKEVRVHIAQKRKISEGDKMAGRHGNKGVVSRILPREDMPFLPNGEPVQIVLNPLGVPSRMNIGQILEAHLGWAACALGMRIESMDKNLSKELKAAGYDVKKYGIPKTINHAVPMAVPVFDGAHEKDIEEVMNIAGVSPTGKTVLYDGRTGEPFDNEVTVGCTYMLKLHHLVADKIHARSTGPYSLVTQQPLGGKAQFGGQRFGEMEVWALEAYGAAYTLQEILTVKSDDVIGRVKTYEAIVKGENVPEPGVPEAFKVLVKELQSIGLDIKVLNEDGDEISLQDDDDVNVIDVAKAIGMDIHSDQPPMEEKAYEVPRKLPDDDEDGKFSIISDTGNLEMDPENLDESED